MDLLLSVELALSIVLVYIVIIKIYITLSRITGLTKEKAKFQVISMLTNSGYTTNESELIVNNRRRRKIAFFCMITGMIFNVIIVSLLINVLFNLTPQEATQSSRVILISVGIFFLLLIISRIPFIKRLIERVFEKIAEKVIGSKNPNNIITELDSYGKNSIVQVSINTLPTNMREKSLADLNLNKKYGLNILLIKRNNRIVEPNANTFLEKGDNIIIFGTTSNINEIFTAKKEEIIDLIDDSKENTLKILDNYGKEAMVEININKVPNFMENKRLAETKLKETYGINILVLKRNENVVVINKDTIIEKNDNLIVLGIYTKIKEAFLLD